MSEDRHALEAQRLERSRLLQAFRRGGRRRSLLDEPRPGRALVLGTGVVALVTVAVGVAGLVSGSAPRGWDTPGNLVVDPSTGTRYVVTASGLRPIVNDTSLHLIYGARPPAPIEVDHDLITARPGGAPVGVPEAPYEPPALIRGAAVLTCERGRDRGIVATTDRFAAGALVVASGARRYLVTQGRAYPVTRDAARALGVGYPHAPDVSPEWLGLLAEGPALRAPHPPRGEPRGPSWTGPGTLVAERQSGRLFVAWRGALRPVANRTTLELVYRGRLPRPVVVGRAAIGTQRIGPTLGSPRWPDQPPPVDQQGKRWACVTTTGAAAAAARPPVAGLTTSPAEARRRIAVYTPRRGAVLVAPGGKAAPSSRGPAAYLLAAGRAFPVATSEALAALGYSPADALRVPRPWLRSLPAGPRLARIDLQR